MTVQYNQLVLTGGPGVFFKLLLKWRGCVFKLIYVDVLGFLAAYGVISCIYRFALPENLQRSFENLVLFTNNFQSMIPVAFILGFYIQLIFSRFWHQFMIIPWGLKFAISLTAHLPGTDERPRLLRRTCMRYVLGSLILTCTRINVVAKKRFPTFESFISAGIFTEEEIKLLEGMQLHVQPFVPIVWTTSLITLAEKEKFITNQHALVSLITEVNRFRQGLLNLFFMDYVCVPLVYTQVVTLSVYSYFIASLFGKQYLMDSSPLSKQHDLKDWYFPFFTLTEFVIYVGLLKVAETLVNPMGEDDEDFDINEVIDFNWKTTWCIVDGMKTSPPAVVRDAHWHQSVVELPHTEESRKLISRPFRGSVYDLDLHITPDYTGSLLSMSGHRKSQDLSISHTAHGKRTSIISSAHKHSSSNENPTNENLISLDEPDLHVSFTVPSKLSPVRPGSSNNAHEAVEEEGEERISPTVQFHGLPNKGFAETITEESEGELEEYEQPGSDSTNHVGSHSTEGPDGSAQSPLKSTDEEENEGTSKQK
ncbi:hypothetical protein P879_08869 [Paragonimus westermani]|uniref:Bestrophin homolog n=1 Tax=Paragonimus westermani TaxID=34504 RepID=A0A8T0D108_9TREM|nr:hypothetical protein P879_08869 [Paragonimus westermani]